MLFAWACLAAAIAFGYLEGVPWLAREATARIPPEQERRLGESALRALDRRGLKPSNLDSSRRTAIAATFATLRSVAGVANVRLEFRDEREMKRGPMAFALPGIVVVGDGIAAALDDAQMGAVMAHELGHLHHRHTVRKVVANSLQAMGALLLYGDVSAIAAIGPVEVTAKAYSRRLEREADDFAFDLLRRTGRSPQDFASAMATARRDLLGPPRVTRVGVEPPRDPMGGYLSTHPSLAEREAAAEVAAAPGQPR
jgi:Zn-dependent protease with chaperone function